MFKSIQLNIDNPHFLVAQGRITKAINLKPTELIGMIEETAGTSVLMNCLMLPRNLPI
jgi:Chromosome segregation ATPases